MPARRGPAVHIDYWPGEPGEPLTLAATDGAELYAERFPRADAGSRTVLVFLHGIGSYAGPFRRFARDVAAADFDVYLPDLRGHGRSGPSLGAMGTPAQVLDDIETLLQRVRSSDPGCEIVLGGESMGALFVLAYAASGRLRPDRLLLLAPALRPLWRNLPKWSGQRSLTPKPDAAWIGFPLQEPTVGEQARNPRFRRSCLDDPMMLQVGSMGYLSAVGRLLLGWAIRYPAKITQPVLLMQGDADAVLSLGATKALADLLPQAELRVIPGAWHNLLSDDPTRDSTTEAIVAWVADGSPTRPRLCVYRWSPFQSWLRSRTLGFRRSCAIVIAVLGLLCACAAASSGTLFAPSGAGMWFTAGAGVVAANAAAVIERTVSLGFDGLGASSPSYLRTGIAAIPLSRDYLFLAGIVLLGCYVAVQQLHWRAISDAPARVEGSGLIDPDTVGADAIDAAVRRADRRANGRKGIAWALAVSGASALSLEALALRYGVYGRLSPGPVTSSITWQQAALAGWWANPSVGSLLTSLSFGVVLFLFIYAMFRGNQVGIAAVEMLDGLLGMPSGSSGRQRSAVRLIPGHPDGYGGLGPVRTILGFAMLSTVLLFLAATVLLLLMPDIGALAVPFLLLLGFVSPYFVSRPIDAVNAELRAGRMVLMADANEGIVRAATGADPSEPSLAYWLWRREAAERLPVEVFSVARFAAGTAAYVIPLASLLVAMSQ